MLARPIRTGFEARPCLAIAIQSEEGLHQGKQLNESYSSGYYDVYQDPGGSYGATCQNPTGAGDTTRCLRCGVVVLRENLTQHMQEVHQMLFFCRLCEMGFRTVSGLKHHLRAHEGRKFTCPICDYKFKHKWHLKGHLKSVHKRAQCSTCSEMFNVGDEFNQHVLYCK
ncbi:zinc finger Y-chromosomal protein [Elysia marginata]|uniref:Zinc finger Y-chromosomal protein n=1 Tax=Elysia marginata TaxID=1093978 RepID=A0AAV4ILS3_9GAST|nr:zinc finger Y-chromosomal protein [Elysia marginata]